MRTPAGVGPDRHTGDRLRRHPTRHSPLGRGIDLGAAERHRHRGDQSPVDAGADRRRLTAPARPPRASAALPDSIAARSPAGQVEQIELGDGVLRNPERLAGAEHEALGPHGAEQRLEMVLGRAPDPADVPPDPRGLLGRGAEVDLLDERPVGVGDDEAAPEGRRGPASAPPRRQLGRAIVGVPLAAVLQPHRQQQRHAGLAAGRPRAPHARPGRIDAVERRDRSGPPARRLGRGARARAPSPPAPGWTAGTGRSRRTVDARSRTARRCPPSGSRQKIPGRWVTHASSMPDAVHGGEQRLRRRAGHAAEWIRAQEGVDVDAHQSPREARRRENAGGVAPADQLQIRRARAGAPGSGAWPSRSRS